MEFLCRTVDIHQLSWDKCSFISGCHMVPNLELHMHTLHNFIQMKEFKWLAGCLAAGGQAQERIL